MTPWGAIIGGVTNIIGDLVTTDKERMELELRGRALDNELLVGQIETNKAEAGHGSVLVAGWRPAAGWVAAIALALMYIPKAIVMTAIWTYQSIVLISGWDGIAPFPSVPLFPDLGAMDLIGLLASLLGLSINRSWEKNKGIDTKRVDNAHSNEGNYH